MATRERGIALMMKRVGSFRRVNFGRNDTKYIIRHPEYRRRVWEAMRAADEGRVTPLDLDEMRARLGL